MKDIPCRLRSHLQDELEVCFLFLDYCYVSICKLQLFPLSIVFQNQSESLVQKLNIEPTERFNLPIKGMMVEC